MKIESLPISVDFLLSPSASTTHQGAFFEDFIGALLRRQGWTSCKRLRVTGQEIDVEATHAATKKRAIVQCKFQISPVSPSVIYQLAGQASADDYDEAYLCSASTLTKDALGLVESGKLKKVNFGFFGPNEIAASLSAQLPTMVEPTTAVRKHLLVWGAQEVTVAYEVKRGSKSEYVVHVADTEQQETLAGLLLACRTFSDSPTRFLSPRSRQLSNAPGSTESKEETIGPTPAADSAADLRPTRPSDFVGREELLRELIAGVDAIADGTSSKRVFSIVGPSGIGKSSLVLRLQNEIETELKATAFMRVVDVRPAIGSSFIGAAIDHLLSAAQEGGFCQVPKNLRIGRGFVEDTGVRGFFQGLEQQRKVLVLFFDQFEEVLMREQYQFLFQEFERLSSAIYAARVPLVLGFSWRNDIMVPVGNKAATAWASTQDARFEIFVDRLNFRDGKRVAKSVARASDAKLSPTTINRIAGVAAGRPWFLKKLTKHISNEVTRSGSEQDVINQKFSVRDLFEGDLRTLQSDQERALREVSLKSPVDSGEIATSYSPELLETLVRLRLVVRVGPKFAIYWDHFRDYLNEKKLPEIPREFVPNTGFETAQKVWAAIQAGATSAETIVRNADLGSIKSVRGVIPQLRDLGLVDGLESDQTLRVNDNLMEVLRESLQEHAIWYAMNQLGTSALTVERFKRMFAERYFENYGKANKQSTVFKYAERILKWFEGAELVRVRGKLIFFSQGSVPGPRKMAGVSKRQRR